MLFVVRNLDSNTAGQVVVCQLYIDGLRQAGEAGEDARFEAYSNLLAVREAEEAGEVFSKIYPSIQT